MSRRFKIERPSEKWHRPETPMWQKLLIVGAICLSVGIQRRFFLVIGAILMVMSFFSWRADEQRLK